MNNKGLQKWRWDWHFRLGLLGLVIALGLAVLIVSGIQVSNELRLLRRASTDNVQWNLSQLEVELLKFSQALSQAGSEQGGDSAQQNVRRRFDILFSRYKLISEGPTAEKVQSSARAVTAMDRIDGFLDRTVPLVDGPAAALREATGNLEMETRELLPLARMIAIEGVTAFARESDLQRDFLATLLLRTSILSGAMILALAGMLVILFRQIGIAERESIARENSNRSLAAMVGASLDAIIVANEKGEVLEFNDAASQMFGYSREEALRRDLSTLIIPERLREAHRTGMARYISTGQKRVVDAGLVELCAMDSQGQEFPVEVSIASAKSEDGTIFVSFLRDISARLRAKEELTSARDDALAADQAKSRFLAVMSHEMRTPLNGILGTLDLLSDTKTTPEQKRNLEIIRKSGALLLKHVNDVLDIAKVEAGKLEIQEEVFSPKTVVDEVVDMNRALAAERGNVIHVDNRLPTDLLLKGDSFRLGQALLNILGNAVKFTSHGRIDLQISEAENGAAIEFRVTDTGIGVAPENLTKVFEDFVTVDSSYSRGAEGTGLGLGIGRRMVEAMGGSIGAESALGQGSSFWFRIPRQPADPDQMVMPPAPAPTTDVPEAARKLSILLVEDHETNRFVARSLLEGLGHSVDEAHNGQEGVEKACRERFDLILMDISMPVLDGIAATEQIRNSGGLSAKSPIVGLTAHAMADEQKRFHRAGMQTTLFKPISRDKLAKLLAGIQFQDDADGLTRTEMTRPGLLDLSVLDQLLDVLGQEKFVRALESFITETESEILELTQNADASSSGMASQAHRMSGAAATFGASELRALLSKCETLSKSGSVDGLPKILSQIAPTWAETKQALMATASK